jgi:hypothetical protein
MIERWSNAWKELSETKAETMIGLLVIVSGSDPLKEVLPNHPGLQFFNIYCHYHHKKKKKNIIIKV